MTRFDYFPGNIFALSSVEFGLSNMIWAAAVIAKVHRYILQATDAKS